MAWTGFETNPADGDDTTAGHRRPPSSPTNAARSQRDACSSSMRMGPAACLALSSASVPLWASAPTPRRNYDNHVRRGLPPVWELNTSASTFPSPDGVIRRAEFNSNSPECSGTNLPPTTITSARSRASLLSRLFRPPAAAWSIRGRGKPAAQRGIRGATRRNPFTWSGAPVTNGWPTNPDDAAPHSHAERLQTGH